MLSLLPKLNWKRILIAGATYFIIAFILRQLEVIATMNYYLMPQYFGVWSQLMMPKAGPPPPLFVLLSSLFTLITGIVLAGFYDLLKGVLSENWLGKVLGFTFVSTLLMLVFSYLPLYLLINLPLGLLVYWFVTGTISIFLSSLIFVKILG
jgi:hypothetical protein